jgi:hypothetical protein
METPRHGGEPQQAEVIFARPKPRNKQPDTPKADGDSPDRLAEERSDLRVRRMAEKVISSTPRFKLRKLEERITTRGSPTPSETQDDAQEHEQEQDAPSPSVDLMIEEEKSEAARREKKKKERTAEEKMRNLEEKIRKVKRKKLEDLLTEVYGRDEIEDALAILDRRNEGKGLKRKRTISNEPQTNGNDERGDGGDSDDYAYDIEPPGRVSNPSLLVFRRQTKRTVNTKRKLSDTGTMSTRICGDEEAQPPSMIKKRK